MIYQHVDPIVPGTRHAGMGEFPRIFQTSRRPDNLDEHGFDFPKLLINLIRFLSTSFKLDFPPF
jgi:hypothetical protein